MSTTIHPAYKLKPDVNLFALSRKIRSELIPEIRKIIANGYVEEAVLEYDRDTEGRTFKEVLLSKLNGFESQYHFESYFKAEIVFFHNPVRDEVYAISYNFPVEVRKMLENFPEVETEWSYWDGNDSQLSHLTHKEWKDREASWDETLMSHEPTGVQGVTVTLFSEYDKALFSLKDFETNWDFMVLPSNETRYRSLLLNVYSKSGKDVFAAHNLTPNDLFNAVMDYLIPGDEPAEERLPYSSDFPDLVQEAVDKTKSILLEKTVIAL